MLGFLPWLPLWEEVSVGHTHFVPFVRGRKPFGADTQEQRIADKILSRFFPSANKPVLRAAIVLCGDHAMTDDLSEEERNQVWEDAEILSLAAISHNDYFCKVGHYGNSSLFAVIFQGFAGQDPDRAVVITRRREGCVWNLCRMEDLNFAPAPGVTLAEAGRFDFDQPMIRALVARRERPGWEAWQDAISYFNLANTDSELIRPHVEMVLMLAAFQRLLNVGSKEKQLTREFLRVLTPHTPLMASASKRCAGARKRDEPLRACWIRQFCIARGAYAHGDLRSRARIAWSIEEFLVLGAFIFPVVVKKLLSADGLYQMLDTDLDKEQAFEQLADSDILHPREDGSGTQRGFAWGEVLEAAQWQRIGRQAREDVAAQMAARQSGKAEPGSPNKP